jgi:hypothetical protein
VVFQSMKRDEERTSDSDGNGILDKEGNSSNIKSRPGGFQ